MTKLLPFFLLAAAVPCLGAEAEPGKKLESQACVQCHSLRLVHSQRLSTAAWTKEVDKMIGWGAPVTDKQTLIAYLAAEYPDSKPVPTPDRSSGQ